MDHLGPFPRNSKGHEHIFVIVDSFTKFTIIRAVKSTATKYVIQTLQEVTSYVGMPGRIISDRGTAFTSKVFQTFCKDNNVKHVLIAVRTPRANGHAERTNRIILSMLLLSTDNERRWDDKLRQVQWSINTMTNKTTGYTPCQLLYGYTPRDILQNQLIQTLQDDQADTLTDTDLQQLRATAATRIDDVRAQAKRRYDARHASPKIYKQGDLVLTTNEPTSTGTSRKLEPRYKGPFVIREVLPNDRYVIEDLPHAQRTQRHYTSVFASGQLKLWCTLPPDDFDDDDPTGDTSGGTSGEGAPKGQESRL
ncbi:PREDICTED: uncharacterized protein LOC108368207 [Rhagoletis zephyria]|uniref:uncharacterized protein LOC108368207 n=1 Tax=Rhagoletis zephyria TaxID=28612 RepID=UPI00081134E8|nr:PREDICTED: uncharacterized protein LOC108368207 [Rhagoletis zephyria]